MNSRKKIALSKSIAKSNLFTILENIFPVTFEESEGSNNYFARIITYSDMQADSDKSFDCHTFCIYKREERAFRNSDSNCYMFFSNSSLVPFPFKNRKIEFKENIDISKGISIREADPILFWQDHCIWAIKKQGKYFQYFSAIDIIDIPIGKSLFEYFKGSNFIALLPLIDFLRRITRNENDQNASSLNACIIFDDPNLHFQRYGFIKYNELASDAQKNNYHVGIATIPLDLYYATSKSVKIFKEYERWLSLLIHGNDHIAYELGRDLNDDKRKNILAKCLQRVRRFESRYGLDISRIMIAPHGDCAESFLLDMASFGIEGAIVSYQGLKNANKNKKWIYSLGYEPFTLFDYFAVANRFRFVPECKNRILLSAYLGHPILPYGHHWDLKDGMDILKGLADFINGIGKVNWMKPHEIFRSNYTTRICGDILIVNPLSPMVHVNIPKGIKFIKILPEKEENKLMNYSYHLCSNRNGRDSKFIMTGDDIIPINSTKEIIIMNSLFCSIKFMNIKTRSSSLGNIARRLLTEIRDHFLPCFDRIILK